MGDAANDMLKGFAARNVFMVQRRQNETDCQKRVSQN